MDKIENILRKANEKKNITLRVIPICNQKVTTLRQEVTPDATDVVLSGVTS